MAIQENMAGIHIADGVVSCARVVRRGRQRIVLTHGGWMEYDADTPEDELVRLVRKLWKKTRMPTRTVACGLQSRSLCLKYFRYPNLTPRELTSALQLEAEESLQLPPEEIALDWHINRPRNDPYTQKGETIHGMLTAVAQREVTAQLNLLKKAGLYPVVVGLPGTALCNLFLALRGEKVDKNRAACVVNLARHHADISILYDDHFIYPRTIISRSSEWSGRVQYLIENISDALLYYHVKVDKTPVTQLVLAGRIPDSPEFIGQIHDTIGLPTEAWVPQRDANFTVSNSLRRSKGWDIESSLMTTSLGLGLRGIM